MVERYTLTSLDDVAGTFGLPVPEGSVPRFNIAPLQLALVRTADALVAARWGLLPPWRGHGGKRGPHVVHAPIDAIDDTPLLRNAFKAQRCLVIADGFYVWRRTGKKPQPIWLHPAGDPAAPLRRSRAIAFAGLAATHRDDGQLSFAIIVGPASPLVAAAIAPPATAAAAAPPIAPIAITADHYPSWLTGSRDAARACLDQLSAPLRVAARPGEAGAFDQPIIDWRAEPVSTWVSSIDHDDPRCIEPIGNPLQGELF